MCRTDQLRLALDLRAAFHTEFGVGWQCCSTVRTYLRRSGRLTFADLAWGDTWRRGYGRRLRGRNGLRCCGGLDRWLGLFGGWLGLCARRLDRNISRWWWSRLGNRGSSTLVADWCGCGCDAFDDWWGSVFYDCRRCLLRGRCCLCLRGGCCLQGCTALLAKRIAGFVLETAIRAADTTGCGLDCGCFLSHYG